MDFLEEVFFYRGLFVIIPAIIGLVRWQKIRAIDRPIILAFFFLFINELTRSEFAKRGYEGYGTYNIGVILLAFIFLWQFYNWGIFREKKWIAFLLGGIYILTWAIDNFVIDDFHKLTRYYRVLMNASLVVMSIAHLNKLIIEERKDLYKNGRFIITTAILIYYLYKIILDIFFLRSLSNEILRTLGNLNMSFVFGEYVFFLIGIICLPKKKTFFMPS